MGRIPFYPTATQQRSGFLEELGDFARGFPFTGSVQSVDAFRRPFYRFRVEDDIQQLADDIYRRKVLRARQLSVGERIDTAIELFEGAVGLMKDGIRAQFPGITEDEVDATVKKRLNRVRQIEEHKIYRLTSS